MDKDEKIGFQHFKATLEALIFAADSPVNERHLKSYLGDDLNGFSITETIAILNNEYGEGGRSFRIVAVADGFQMITQPQFASYIKKMYMGRVRNKLSQAALEVLAVISFKQPISKADISAVRGANSDSVVKNLLERRLITISGRGEGIGRPLLYSTTSEFLEYFGINSINELPKPREIEELFKEGKYSDQLVDALADLDESFESDDSDKGSEQTGDELYNENQTE